MWWVQHLKLLLRSFRPCLTHYDSAESVCGNVSHRVLCHSCCILPSTVQAVVLSVLCLWVCTCRTWAAYASWQLSEGL